MKRTQRWTLVVLTVLLSASVGCDRLWLGSAGSFGLGWVARSLQPSPVVRECFENGVMIDCADLPAEVGS